MTLKDLIALLKTKDQSQEVEFIVCSKSGKLIAMDVEANATDLITVLNAFGKK